jgi:SAM-dependent methyltransferase
VAVRARKELVKRELKALLARRAGAHEPVRVLSIAAGPAAELAQLFDEIDDLRAPVEVVLFEQDKGALAHAWRRLEPTVSARFPGRARFTYLHDSIKRLLRDRDLLAPFGQFELVYSVGLLDYLQPLTAVSFLRNLAAAVAPDGRLLVANMVDHPARWYLEVPLDWSLIYRTRDELLDIGARAMPGAGARILEEETGANPFLELTRT